MNNYWCLNINGDTSTVGYNIPLLLYTWVVSDAFQAEWISAR